jgi:hypothetical protein
MDQVPAGLPFAYCYLDDLRIAIPGPRDSSGTPSYGFQEAEAVWLHHQLEKCVVAVDSFEFLGHMLSAQGARLIASYGKAMEKRPPPTTIKELQVFLGMVNVLRRFLPGVANVLRPLTDALKGIPACY